MRRRSLRLRWQRRKAKRRLNRLVRIRESGWRRPGLAGAIVIETDRVARLTERIRKHQQGLR